MLPVCFFTPSSNITFILSFNTISGFLSPFSLFIRDERYPISAGESIWPKYDKSTSSNTNNTNTQKPNNKPVNKNIIGVDGKWGKETTIKAQQIFKTVADGIVSNQYASYKADNPGLLSTTFEWKNNPSGGSDLIKAIQKKVGITADGHIGPKTIKAMQKWLGTVQDGCVSNPSNMVKAFQQWLNKQ